MEKKISITFVLIFTCAFIGFIYLKQIRVSNPMAKNLVVAKLKSKLYLYEPFIDSANYGKFKQMYKNVVDEIFYLEDKKIVIGERLKIYSDTMIIEIFTLSVGKKKSKISFFKSINGVIEKSEYYSGNYYPDYSLLCNEHYFYLPKSVNSNYDSYSISIIDGQSFYDTKIFFLNKYDSFINIKCPCNKLRVDEIVNYINQQFANK